MCERNVSLAVRKTQECSSFNLVDYFKYELKMNHITYLEVRIHSSRYEQNHTDTNPDMILTTPTTTCMSSPREVLHCVLKAPYSQHPK